MPGFDPTIRQGGTGQNGTFFKAVEINDNYGNPFGTATLGALITVTGATTTQTGTDQVNNGRGVVVVLNTTAIGTGSVTLSIQGKDTASGQYYTILSGAAVTTNTTNVYTVYPGITATANVSASNVLPSIWRVIVTANNANAATYTVGACLIL